MTHAMIRLFFFLFAMGIVPLNGLYAGLPKENPLPELQDLISSTESFLENQKKLYQYLEAYLALHRKSAQNLEDRKLLFKTAQAAAFSLELIKSEHLSYLFEPEFLSEMTLFAKLASRPNLPEQL